MKNSDSNDTSIKSKKQNRRILITLLFVVFVLFIMIGILRQPARTFTVKYVSNTVVIFAVLYVNVLLLVAFLLLLFRNITKIIQERSQKIPGSRFSTRLILIFTFLTLVPTLLLFFIASDLISTNVDQWFSQPVEVINQNSSKIINEITREYLDTVKSDVKKLSNRIYTLNLLESRDDLVANVENFLEEYNIDIVHIYFRSRANPIIISADSLNKNLNLDLPANELQRCYEGQQIEYHDFRNERVVVSSGYPIYRSTEDKTNAIGVAVASHILPEKISFLIRQSQTYYNDYMETKKQKINIKSTNILLLSMITLILLFSATWLGMRLAREITVPIRKLIEGTQQISLGNLSYRVDVRAGDELAILVNSFNKMSEELLISKKKFEDSNLQLVESHKVLEEQFHYIETVLANIPAGIISVDSTGIISTSNRAAAEMLELDPESIPNIHYRTVLRSKLYADLKKIFTSVNRKKKSDSKVIEIQLRTELKKIAIVCSPLRDKSSNFLGSVMVMEDLTELSRAQKMAAWREVARRIAHEIRNPLTPIQLSAQRLRKKASTSDDAAMLQNLIRECSDSILDEVFTLKRLVDEFSLFARMPEVKLVKVELNQIIDSAISPYRDPANGLKIDLDLNKLPQIHLDPDQMKRALRNLIDNSIEAMHPVENKTLRIKSSVNSRNNIEIILSDTGPGINKNELDKIFVPYFSSKKKGTGLGLAIVKKIIDEHNGKISVVKNSSRGTSFAIEIPIGG